jgi:TPR repeat protein
MSSVRGVYVLSSLQLGLLHNQGQEVTQDYVKAREWYQKAAEAGNATAMFNLGLLYYHGEGVTQDYVKAREWFQKGSKTGHAAPIQAIVIQAILGSGPDRKVRGENQSTKLKEQSAADP